MRLLLVGNYGVQNLGDEALKEYFLQTFPSVEWQVVSAHPKAGEYPRLPFGIRSLFCAWWKTIGAIRRSDGMVFGGGSLFTDVESVKACWIWWWHALWARVFGKKVYLAFQGVGPFSTKKGEALARKTFEKSAFISVRDEASAARVRSWALDRKIVQSFDPVFALIEAEKESTQPKNVFMIIPRKNSGESFKKMATEMQSKHQDSRVAIVLLQPEDPEEREQVAQLQKLFPQSSVHPVNNLMELTNLLHSASFVVTQRYHAALLAFGVGAALKIVWQEEGDKLWELSRVIDAGTTPTSLLQRVKDGETALRDAMNLPST